MASMVNSLLKLLPNEDADHPCFQILRFRCKRYLMGWGVGSRCPITPQPHAKYVTSQKE